MKSWYCENVFSENYCIAVNNFDKTHYRRCLIGFWICLGFWFWLYHRSEYVNITLDSEYAWIIPEYAEIGVNVPKSAWMAFFPIVIPCLLEHVCIYFNVYTKLEVSLKNCEAVFLKRQNLIFSVVAGSIWFTFCFKTKYFYKVSELISKNVILPAWKALWTSLKLSQKVGNCNASLAFVRTTTSLYWFEASL